MGHWGTQSYDSDVCHDLLDSLEENKYTPNVEMLEHLLTTYCKPSRVDVDYADVRELYLGVVMWGLHHSVVIARKRLQHALKCARQMMGDTEYLTHWRNPNERKQSIQSEIDQIQKWFDLTPKEFAVQKAVGSI